jgi:phosphomannomutase
MDEAMEEVGGKVLRTKVGDVNVAEVMIEENASFGGEPSGTWLHPDFCMCPDGILSGLRMAEIVSKEGKLSELLEKFHQYPHMREKVICSKEEKFKVMENMEDLLKDAFDDIKDINTESNSFNDIQMDEYQKFIDLSYSELLSMFHMSKPEADELVERIKGLDGVDEIKTAANERLDENFFDGIFVLP